MRKKKKIIVAVSGRFDPVHVGHIRLFKETKKLGDELVVIGPQKIFLKLKFVKKSTVKWFSMLVAGKFNPALSF